MTRVVVTGYNMITPFGNTKATWDGIINGKTKMEIGDGRVFSKLNKSNIDGSEFNSHFKRLDPTHCLGLEAVNSVLKMSDLEGYDVGTEDTGIVMGSMFCGMSTSYEVTTLFNDGKKNKIYPALALQVTNNALSGQIAIENGFKGPNITLSTACSSGSQAIIVGTDLIKLEKAQIMVAGGVDIIPPEGIFQVYDNLRVLVQNNPPRPFSFNREGFAIGEGAGVVVLENYEHAIQRGAKIYGEVLGTAATCDAYSMAIPDSTGDMIAKTMNKAICDAGMSTDGIDYINAHATGTKIGDATESKAIKNLFGDMAYKLPISSVKGSLGHTMGAAGAIEAIISLLALNDSVLPPTINHEGNDSQCDLNYIPNKAVTKDISRVLSNSFGFGGNNASIVLGKVNN